MEALKRALKEKDVTDIDRRRSEKTYPGYPKIETLYARDENFKIDVSKPRRPEFWNIQSWLVTEKIDGTNLLVMWDGKTLTFGGRTANAQWNPHNQAAVEGITPALLAQVFDVEPREDGSPVVVIYGEGYGGRIQKGGNYRKTPALRIFDVKVGHLWLNWESVEDVATKLGVPTVPVLSYNSTLGNAISHVNGRSVVGEAEGGEPDYQREGVICRTEPLLLTRRGDRLMWKLKWKDFLGKGESEKGFY